MTAGSQLQDGQQSGRIFERQLRLATGLILFAYAVCHFTNHAFGLVSLGAMQVANTILIDPWTTVPGDVLLYGSFAFHASLGLRALFRRRQFLRVPWDEALQLASGLLIPFLLIGHAVQTRLGHLLYGLRPNYEAILVNFWLADRKALFLQFVLLLVVWVHGCIGIRASLRLRPAYATVRPWLVAVTLLVPLLAIAGVFSASIDVERSVAHDPAFAARYSQAEPGSAVDSARRDLGALSDKLSLGWIALVGATLFARLARGVYVRRFKTVQITYPGGQAVRVTRGFSVLEASRWAGLPHASVCGGRGRCSTCRVRILSGEADLPPPNAVELLTLQRIDAPAHVRLACQLRPIADVKVAPLLAPNVAQEQLAEGQRGAFLAGQERVIVALFADLRDSTRITAGKLPFDALFLVDCWIQAVSGAVHREGGQVTSVAGDGVMAIFGVDVDPDQACRQALAAADAIGRAVETLNLDLEPSLTLPLRFGVGIHVGLAIVGYTTLAREDGARSLQFFGDPGNVASRLEALTKERGCSVLASRAVLDYAGLVSDPSTCFELTVRGRDEVAPLLVCSVGLA